MQSNNLIEDQIDYMEVKPASLCWIEAKNGASAANLFSIFLNQFTYVCLFTFMDNYQPTLLRQTYALTDSASTVSGDLIFWDNIFIVFT